MRKLLVFEGLDCYGEFVVVKGFCYAQCVVVDVAVTAHNLVCCFVLRVRLAKQIALLVKLATIVSRLSCRSSQN